MDKLCQNKDLLYLIGTSSRSNRIYPCPLMNRASCLAKNRFDWEWSRMAYLCPDYQNMSSKTLQITSSGEARLWKGRIPFHKVEALELFLSSKDLCIEILTLPWTFLTHITLSGSIKQDLKDLPWPCSTRVLTLQASDPLVLNSLPEGLEVLILLATRLYSLRTETRWPESLLALDAKNFILYMRPGTLNNLRVARTYGICGSEGQDVQPVHLEDWEDMNLKGDPGILNMPRLKRVKVKKSLYLGLGETRLRAPKLEVLDAMDMNSAKNCLIFRELLPWSPSLTCLSLHGNRNSRILFPESLQVLFLSTHVPVESEMFPKGLRAMKLLLPPLFDQEFSLSSGLENLELFSLDASNPRFRAPCMAKLRFLYLRLTISLSDTFVWVPEPRWGTISVYSTLSPRFYRLVQPFSDFKPASPFSIQSMKGTPDQPKDLQDTLHLINTWL